MAAGAEVEAPEAEEPPPAYSPTSPASDVPEAELAAIEELPELNSSRPPTTPKSRSGDLGGDLVPAAGGNKDSEKTPASRPVWVPTEEITAGESSETGRRAGKQLVPELVTGSRLDKKVPMHPGHWIKIGRNPKAHLMCNNPGVSRNQVSVKWDAHEHRVEMRLEARAGTLVNGKEVKESRRLLEHGDRIRIVGKGQTFDFLLDLRPVGLGSGDPRYRARVNTAKTKSGPVQRRDTLRAQMQHLEKAIAHLEAKAFEREQEYYDIATRRRLRAQEQTEREEKHKFYIEDAKVLEVELERGRTAWLAKLDEMHAKNEDDTVPFIEDTAGLQDRLEKLQLKKDEVARSIHPEQYAVADVALSIGEMTPQEETKSLLSHSAHPNDAEGEEDAFAGLSGLPAGASALSSDEEGLVPAKRKAQDTEGLDSGNEEVDDFLQGEAAAPEAKRQRVDAEAVASA